MSWVEMILIAIAAGFGAWWLGFGWEGVPVAFLVGMWTAVIVSFVRRGIEKDE